MRNLFFVVALMAVVWPAATWAQGTEDDPIPDLDGGLDEAAKPVIKKEQPADGRSVTEYKDESIYIVQQRAYSKSGNLEVSPFFFTALNPKFVGYAGGALSFTYHIKENVSVEFLSSIPLPYLFSAFYSDLVVEVYSYETLTPQVVDLKQVDYFGALSLQFSALYGKLEFYGYLFDYDFYVTGGFGVATTLEPCDPGSDGCTDKPVGWSEDRTQGDNARGLRRPEDGADAYKIAANLGGGLRVFFRDWVGLRVEVRDIAFADRTVEDAQTGENFGSTETDIRNVLMLFLGASFMY